MSPREHIKSAFDAILGELKHPEWVRAMFTTCVIVGSISASAIVVYQKSTSYIEKQKQDVIKALTPLVEEAQEISKQNQSDIRAIRSEMLDRRTFRTFLKQWDAKNPSLPATPMFDDTFNSSGLYLGVHDLAFEGYQ